MWPFRKSEPEPVVQCNYDTAKARTRAEWMERLKEAKGNLIAAEAEWRLTVVCKPQTDDAKILRDLWRQKLKWRRREYSWLLTHALRCGVLDEEDYTSTTGELPVSALGWP